MAAWKVIEIIGCLLERSERDAVLGDIQERGVNVRALFDLIGLAAVRQLQAWKFWRTWLLAALTGISVLAVGGGAQVIADTASYYPWPDLSDPRRIYFLWLILCRAVAIIGLAWATGFTVSSLARYRATSILIALACVLIWQPINLTSLGLLGIVPGILGFRRGWRRASLAPNGVFVLLIVCLPAFLIPGTTTWAARIYTAGAFWPAFYLLTSSFVVPLPKRNSRAV